MFIDLKNKGKRAFADIDDSNRDAIIEWLNDRKDFHTWFTSVITGSFIVLTVFGNTPWFENITQKILSTALIFLFISVLCILVTLWSIPSWKIMIKWGIVDNASFMRIDLRITTWIGMCCFLVGLTLGFIGNMPY